MRNWICWLIIVHPLARHTLRQFVPSTDDALVVTPWPTIADAACRDVGTPSTT
jgi:hypothetical protein